MRAPNSRTEGSPALCVASRPNSTSAIPPCAALVANLALSFADEHANIKSGATTHMGAAKPIIFRHIILPLFSGEFVCSQLGCSASILNPKRLLLNRTQCTRSASRNPDHVQCQCRDGQSVLTSLLITHSQPVWRDGKS